MENKFQPERKVECTIAGQEVTIVWSLPKHVFWNCEVVCPYFEKNFSGYPRCQKGGKCVIYEGLKK